MEKFIDYENFDIWYGVIAITIVTGFLATIMRHRVSRS